MTLGEKIYNLRTEKGFSQEALGEKLGVSRQSVSKWETDQSVPELDKIVAISEVFGVSTDYLLKEEEEAEELKDAAFSSKKSIKIKLDEESERNRDLVLAFARRFRELDEQDFSAMKKILEKE